MRADDRTRTEADAADHAAHLGASEHIGNPVGEQDVTAADIARERAAAEDVRAWQRSQAITWRTT